MIWTLPATTPEPPRRILILRNPPCSRLPPCNWRQFKDGSFQLVITAGGDMTIGGDVRKRGDSF